MVQRRRLPRACPFVSLVTQRIKPARLINGLFTASIRTFFKRSGHIVTTAAAHIAAEPRRQTMSKFLKLIRNEEGATAIEYGLIAALIAVAAIGAMQGIGNKLNTTFNNVSNNLN